MSRPPPPTHTRLTDRRTDHCSSAQSGVGRPAKLVGYDGGGFAAREQESPSARLVEAFSGLRLRLKPTLTPMLLLPLPCSRRRRLIPDKKRADARRRAAPRVSGQTTPLGCPDSRQTNSLPQTINTPLSWVSCLCSLTNTLDVRFFARPCDLFFASCTMNVRARMARGVLRVGVVACDVAAVVIPLPVIRRQRRRRRWRRPNWPAVVRCRRQPARRVD